MMILMLWISEKTFTFSPPERIDCSHLLGGHQLFPPAIWSAVIVAVKIYQEKGGKSLTFDDLHVAEPFSFSAPELSVYNLTRAVLVCPQQCQQAPPLPLFLPTWSRSPRRPRRAPCSRRTATRWKCRRTSSPLSAHSLPVSLHKLVPYVLKGSFLWMPKIFMRKLPVWVGWQAKWNFGNKNLWMHFLKRFRSKKPLKFATIFDIF